MTSMTTFQKSKNQFRIGKLSSTGETCEHCLLIKMAVQLKKSVSGFMKETTVEPIMFLYTLASLHHPALQALIYQKACLMDFTDDICDNLMNENLTAEEDAVQTEASLWFMYENICFEVPCIFVTLFYGTISDSWSRKASLVLPVIGQLLSVITYMINVHFMDSHVGYILIGRVISGLFGGWLTIHMAMSSYLSAFTTEKTRTSRIAIMQGIHSLAAAVAGITSGFILDNTSFVFVFSLTMAIYVVTILYTIIFLKELERDIQNRKANQNWTTKSCTGFLDTATASLKCLLKKRRFNRRVHCFVILACMFTYTIGHQGNFLP